MRRTSFSALTLLLLGVPGSASAQASESRAHAALELSLAATPVRESTTAFAGGAGLISLGGRFAVGAGGGVMLGTSTVESAGAGADLDLSLAYAGLLLQARMIGSEDRYLAFRTLIGAGNAKLELPLVGAEFAADNFGVLEPEVTTGFSVAGPLHLGLSAGYRTVFGVDDLPNVTATDLKGFVIRARLSLHIK